MIIPIEVGSPKWVSQESAYIFQFTNAPRLDGTIVSTDTDMNLPDLTNDPIVDAILTGFLEKTKQFFVTPLTLEMVKKHLTHNTLNGHTFPAEEGFYKPVWAPASLKMKSNEFGLSWVVEKWERAQPLIGSDFFRSETPAPQSPEPSGKRVQPNLRTIHIQNTMDSLVPVGDLPLSDLPPLNFGEQESPERKEVRRRIREARLKVELAKLKAKRMEQKYYERYGEVGGSEESSLDSSETDSDEPMGGKYSYP